MRLKAQGNIDEALAYAGVPDAQADPRSLVRMQDAMTTLEESLAPQGVFAVFPITAFEPDAVQLGDGAFTLPGQSIRSFLDGASEAVLMAATLGFESERVVKGAFARSNVDGLFADAAASALAEAAAEELHRRVREDASARGMHAGARFSPGYGDLALSIQGPFLRACGADRALGINVTPADLLVPSKSVTAVVAVYASEEELAAHAGEGVSVDEAAQSPASRKIACDDCNLNEDCRLREQGRTCHG